MYFNYVSQSKIIAKLVRSNRGRENEVIAGLQSYFLRSTSFPNSSFRFGSSVENHGTESFWPIMQRSRLNLWINFLKDLYHQGHFTASIACHADALRFSFMGFFCQSSVKLRSCGTTTV